MKITPVANRISFQRQLTPEELKAQAPVRDRALNILGQTGQSVFIINGSCLPQSSAHNTGVSNFASDDSIEFLKYMKDYIGFNTVEDLPQNTLFRYHDTYINYGGNAFSPGAQLINPELLTTDEFNNILTKEEFNQIVAQNKKWEFHDSLANFENVLEENSPQMNALKKAHERFKQLDENTSLKINYNKYIEENDDLWLHKEALFNIFQKENGKGWYKHWKNQTDRDLFKSSTPENVRSARINEVLRKHKNDYDFVKFINFLADNHLSIAREKLHSIGLTLKGDCKIGFGQSEQWGFADAFPDKNEIGWGLPAPDYTKIKDPNSEAAKVVRLKTYLCAKRYDSIRFDVGWAYIAPRINKKSVEIGDDSLLKMIEGEVAKAKGIENTKENMQKLCAWEFEAGPEDFSPFKDGKLRPELKNRVSIYSQAHINEDWGYLEDFIERGWANDELMLGVGNHDPINLRQLAEGVDPLGVLPSQVIVKQRNKQIPVLAKLLKLDGNVLKSNPVEYAKAKFALPLNGKNIMMFYIDVFGLQDRFNNTHKHNWKDFRNKLPENYKESYHKSLQEGFGFNIMDSIAKRFKAAGLDEKHPNLYNEIIKFRDILTAPEQVLESLPERVEAAPLNTQAPPVSKSGGGKGLKTFLVIGSIACAAGLGIYYALMHKFNPAHQNEKEA